MAQDNCQKIKLLKLLELLRQETDEQHPLTTMDICNRLGAMGISCERRTLSKDGDVLFTGSSETPDECGMSSVLTEQTDEKLLM